MSPPAYTVVIPTCGARPDLLKGVLACFAGQTTPPAEVIVVDSSTDAAARAVCDAMASRVNLRHQVCRQRSAARQRNQGAAEAAAPVIVFCDDDMSFPPDLVARLLAALDDPDRPLAGVAASIEGFTHPPPGPLLRAYYRWQAGYAHPDYGGRLFGPAINCWPCYENAAAPLIPAQWLNSALVAYRADVFMAEQFPGFEGYSYMEDVHLSARIARHHALAFHRDAVCRHLGTTSSSARHAIPELVRMQWENRIKISRDIIGAPPAKLARQLQAHRLFVLVHLLRSRPDEWRKTFAALCRLKLSP